MSFGFLLSIRCFIQCFLNAALENTSVLEASEVTVGNPIVIKGAATGGTAPYTFTYQYKRSTATEWSSLGSGATAKLTPGSAGTFNIRAFVKDSTGKTVVKSLTAKVV